MQAMAEPTYQTVTKYTRGQKVTNKWYWTNLWPKLRKVYVPDSDDEVYDIKVSYDGSC